MPLFFLSALSRRSALLAVLAVLAALAGWRALVFSADLRARRAAALLRRPAERHDYTRAELETFDGSDPHAPILLAVRGEVFDVGSSAAYAPGGAYQVLAGCDATFPLAKGVLRCDEQIVLGSSMDELTEKQRKKLEGWADFFYKKYGGPIGKLVDVPPPRPPPTERPPPPSPPPPPPAPAPPAEPHPASEQPPAEAA